MLPNKHHCLSIKTKLKLRRSITFSIILGFIAIVTCMPVSADSLKNINVLFVFSWHQGMPWQVEIEKGFKEHLKKESSKPNLFLEYMDAGRFKSRQQIYIFKDYLSKKYMGHQIDYVIYESRPAFKLFKSYPKLFENAKKYIVNPGPIHDSIHSESFTAIPVNANYEKAAQEILTVSKGKTIYLIAGATKSGKERTKKFTDSLSKFDPGKEVIPLIGLPMDQLLKKISNLKSDSIIFYLLVFQDGDGIRYIPYDAATQISHQASVPVYSLWTSLFGSGIVGGYMLSGEMVGQVAASILMNPKFAKNIDPKNLTSEFHGFFMTGVNSSVGVLKKIFNLLEVE